MFRYRTQKEEEETARDTSLHYHTYSTLLKLKVDYASKKALSAVLFTDGSFGCVVSPDEVVSLRLSNVSQARAINGMEYNHWILDDDPVPLTSDWETEASLLFLPLLRLPTRQGMYTVISSRWQEYRGGEFQLPQHIQSKNAFVEI